jgi:hypothetical protein
MSEKTRAATGSHPGKGARATTRDAHAHLASDDEMEKRISRALRSREGAPATVAVFVDHIEARLAAAADQDERLATVTHLTRRGGKVVATSVVLSAFAVYGAGAAAAANPYTDGARVLEKMASAVGINWSAMPAGYTRAEYDAFWGAGYTDVDIAKLNALWHTDGLETKAHAGQMIIDGSPVPVAPSGAKTMNPSPQPSSAGSAPIDSVTPAQQNAFFGAGYTESDASKLGALWHSDNTEAKAHAGQMLLDGKALPFAPGVSPSSSTRP